MLVYEHSYDLLEIIVHDLFVAVDCSQNISEKLNLLISDIFDLTDHIVYSIVLLDKFVKRDVPQLLYDC